MTGIVVAAALTPLLFLPPQLDEVSGIATSGGSNDWFYVHEDSGAEAEFHAVGKDGRLLASYRLPDVQARDWEDMARGPDNALWFGDIGDNSGTRERGLLVHRVAEPNVDADGTGTHAVIDDVVSYRLRYPDGPRNAETLLVHPTSGRVHVVAKPIGGPAGVYAAPEPLDPTGPNLLERVADVAPQRTGTPGGPDLGSLAQGMFTGGDIAPDGSKLALRTYTDLYEWRLGTDLAQSLAAEPRVTALPPTRQGEAVAYTEDGQALLVTTEQSEAPVYRVPSALSDDAPEPAAPGPAGEQPSALGRLAVVLLTTVLALLLLPRVARRYTRRSGL